MGRRLGQGGPDLLAVDHILVAVAAGAGAQAGQVHAGLGLGVALGPVVLARQRRREPALLLFGAAVLHQHRPHLDHAVLAIESCAPALVLLGEDDLLQRAQAHAAVLHGPAGRNPAPLDQVVDPLLLLAPHQAARRVADRGRIVRLDVGPDDHPELLVSELVPIAVRRAVAGALRGRGASDGSSEISASRRVCSVALPSHGVNASAD